MSHWVSIWGQSHTDIRRVRPVYRDRTCLLTVRSAFEGAGLRLRVSNLAGRRPMTVAAASVKAGAGKTVRALFGGRETLTLPPGGETYSDGLDIPVRRGDHIQVRLAFRGPVGSGNTIRADVHCSVDGDYTAGGPFDTLRTAGGPAVPALSSVELLAPADAGALICFGDSITQMGMWTAPLAEELFRREAGLSLINKGIGGGRLLHGPASPAVSHYGPAGIQRFRRDVLDEAGAAAVLMAIGTNDIGHVPDPSMAEWTDADMLAKALAGLAGQARDRGLAVYGATVPPCMGCEGFGPGQETERERLNWWIRAGEGTVFDRVIDLDAVLRDPDRPERMDMPWDSGDHLHPGALGGLRMAGEVLSKLSL